MKRTTDPHPPPGRARRPSRKIVVTGTPVAPGVAVGVALFHEMHDVDVPVLSIEEQDVPAEQERCRAALVTAHAQLIELQHSIEQEVGKRDALIFGVQQLLVDDPSLQQGILERVREHLVNAEVAVRDEMAQWEKRLAAVGAGGEKDPTADLRDVAHRILRILAGHPSGVAPLPGSEEGQQVVLVTRELLPSDAAHLDRQRLAGIVTQAGGVAGHAAILARGLGIPSVSGIDVASLPARGGRWIVDGVAGQVIVNPTPQDVALARRRAEYLRRFRAELLQDTKGIARTRDGTPIEILLNVENWQSLAPDVLEDLRGIGLYRTEFLFMNRDSFPSEEEQYAHYCDALRSMGDREIVFRTIDVGGDKPLPYLSVPAEPNPVLGWRGLRLSLEWPDMFYTQLRALLRASAHGHLRVLLPMVTMVEEFRRARDILREIHGDLVRRGVPCAESVPLGAMIEVPAAALAARSIAEEADFLSLGTNDLSQYALAVDRNNARVSHLYQQMHPGVLSIIRHVVDAAGKSETPVSVCGEMAGDPEAVLLLLGMGVRSLSMSPIHVPMVKRLVSAVKLEQTQRILKEVFALSSTTEIRAHVRARTLRLAPELAAFLQPEA